MENLRLMVTYKGIPWHGATLPFLLSFILVLLVSLIGHPKLHLYSAFLNIHCACLPRIGTYNGHQLEFHLPSAWHVWKGPSFLPNTVWVSNNCAILTTQDKVAHCFAYTCWFQKPLHTGEAACCSFPVLASTRKTATAMTSYSVDSEGYTCANVSAAEGQQC